MNSNIAIRAENISKQYRLGEVGTGTISHDLNRFWAKVRGKEDPFLQIGESNDRLSKGQSDYVWSLRDINFEVEKGDAVGIVGRNGAGKSTLLKLLSRVTKPTTGHFEVQGRIASLLEVGTGFNPEMTGRENVFLNGAILGMRRHEIKRKFDEIVAFAGVERYIDTPVKRYSSGMYVRLAFSVAAHLESEILIVDEVLAVGDAEFQKKCLGKMGDISKGEGRTVLFVSHNMAAVQNLCDKGILLNNGTVQYQGGVEETINLYRQNNDLENSGKYDFDAHVANNSKEVLISDFEIQTSQNENTINIGDALQFKVGVTSKIKTEISIRITLFSKDDIRVLTFDSRDAAQMFLLSGGDTNEFICRPAGVFTLRPDVYKVNVSLKLGEHIFDYIQGAAYLKVLEGDYYNSGRFAVQDMSLILMKHQWAKK